MHPDGGEHDQLGTPPPLLQIAAVGELKGYGIGDGAFFRVVVSAVNAGSSKQLIFSRRASMLYLAQRCPRNLPPLSARIAADRHHVLNAVIAVCRVIERSFLSMMRIQASWVRMVTFSISAPFCLLPASVHRASSLLQLPLGVELRREGDFEQHIFHDVRPYGRWKRNDSPLKETS